MFPVYFPITQFCDAHKNSFVEIRVTAKAKVSILFGILSQAPANLLETHMINVYVDVYIAEISPVFVDLT